MKKQSIAHDRAARAGLPSPLRYAAFLLLASTLHGANVDTYWNTGNGDWMEADNWTAGLPGAVGTGDVSRAFFESVAGQPTSIVVNAGEDSTFGYMAVAQGKKVTLQMQDGVTLQNTGVLLVGRAPTGASGVSGLTVQGPETGSAWFNFSQLQVGGKADASGDSIIFSGENLHVSGGSLTVGRLGNGHSLTFQDGVKGEFTSVLISATADASTGGIGNNDKFYVTGPGTEVTVRSTGINGLTVGPRTLANQSASRAPTGNAALISNGGIMRVIGENASTVSEVFVGGAIYRSNNSIQVTGANSLFEVSGNTAIVIGTANDTSYGNYLSVGSGGTVRTDAATTISNGPSTVLSRRNYLAIESGGSFFSSKAITNNGGLVRLSEGGVLKGETVSGDDQAIALNINGTGRFEASGSGLADNVTVNIGSATGSATLAVGTTGRTQAAELTLSSTVNMNANSVLEVAIFGANAIDSIALEEGSSFVIGSDVTLSLSLSSYTLKAGDSFQLFTGNFDNVSGAFASILAPNLDSGLEFDWSQFNVDGGWRFTVIPEPSSVLLLTGAGLVVLGFGCRARRTAVANG